MASVSLAACYDPAMAQVGLDGRLGVTAWALLATLTVAAAGCSGADGSSVAPPAAGLDDDPTPGGPADEGEEPTEPGDDPVDGEPGDPTDAGAPDAGDGGDAGAQPPAGPLKVYMDPAGVDTRDGLTPATAVKTLGRVQAILAAKHGTKAWGHDVEVRIAPGRYVGQTVSWSHTSAVNKITFMPAAGDKNRPVFDGCASAGSCVAPAFVSVSARAGKKTNLHFEYIAVKRYTTAFTFNGNRDDATKWNGGNRLFGCLMEDIGNAHAPALTRSTAAVRFVNSDENVVENNHFIRVLNASPSDGALLHAIYAAHGSDRNRIAGNRFVTIHGDAVRLRDFSNGNVITKNVFVKAGIKAGYSDWYCDHDVRNDCTKATAECPSWQNQFRDNTLDGTITCGPLGVFHYFQDDATSGCTKPAGAVRLSTSGNTQTPKACSGL